MRTLLNCFSPDTFQHSPHTTLSASNNSHDLIYHTLDLTEHASPIFYSPALRSATDTLARLPPFVVVFPLLRLRAVLHDPF